MCRVIIANIDAPKAGGGPEAGGGAPEAEAAGTAWSRSTAGSRRTLPPPRSSFTTRACTHGAADTMN